jgi:hypothetical protein
MKAKERRKVREGIREVRVVTGEKILVAAMLGDKRD